MLPRLEANQCCKGCMSQMKLLQHWLQTMVADGSSTWQPDTLREGFSKLANQRVHLDACRPDACPKLYILLGVGGCISDNHLPWLHLIHLHCHKHLSTLSLTLLSSDVHTFVCCLIPFDAALCRQGALSVIPETGLVSAQTRKQHDNQQSLPSTSICVVLHVFTHDPGMSQRLLFKVYAQHTAQLGLRPCWPDAQRNVQGCTPTLQPMTSSMPCL